VPGFQDPWHPAVLRHVGEIGAAGTSLGKPVGVCGEAAADPKLAVVLVGLGATSLSMSAPAIADVRDELARWTPTGAREAARIALAAEDATGARTAVEALTPA
jgi:phosphotransferase system enzyme I (PtsI)